MSATTGLRTTLARVPAALYRLAPRQAVVDVDVVRWCERNGLPCARPAATIPSLLVGYPEFRNLFYYRVRRGGTAAKLLVWVTARLWREMPTLDLACDDIGPGLTLAHGHGTVVAATSIGSGCWIHHQVTIGWDYKTRRAPRLGDDVFVGVGAKILGDVTIGDGARIGANAVVLSDVPAGATAVGVPAHIVPARRGAAAHGEDTDSAMVRRRAR